MRLVALRGAISVEENEAAAILEATEELVRAVMERNGLRPERMVSCLFTSTDDLNAEFPAVAARRLGLSEVPLLCAREIDVPGALPRIIRLMLHCYADEGAEPRHVYLRQAVALRRDLEGGAVTIEFVDRLREIPVYPAARAYGFEGELVRLASNETPYPPHPAVLEAIEGALRGLNRYPDPTAGVLRRRLSERFDVPVERIAVGNGSCEILLAAAEAMLEPGAEIVYAWPSFTMYPHLAAMTGARAVTPPLDAHDRHDLDALAREVTAATRILIVCNPNNPTATGVDTAALESMLDRLPRHVLVLVDEAYVEFAVDRDPDETLPLLEGYPNLVLLRTFSKVYGLCGLRAGYALAGAPSFREAVDRVRQPFSVNALAQAAAAEALDHQDEVARRVERTVAERLFLADELAERGLTCSEGQANFAWVSLGERPEAAVLDGLAERGVIVRGGTDLGSTGHVRVTFGTRPENERFLEALDAVLAGL